MDSHRCLFSFHESSLTMTHAYTQIFLYYENNFPDSSLFFKRKSPQTSSLWLFVSSHLAISWRLLPLLLFSSPWAVTPPLLLLFYTIYRFLSLFFSCLPSLLQSLHLHHPLCLPLPVFLASLTPSPSVGLMWDWLSLRIQPSSKGECGWMRASHWGSNLALVNEPPLPPSSSFSSSSSPPPDPASPQRQAHTTQPPPSFSFSFFSSFLPPSPSLSKLPVKSFSVSLLSFFANTASSSPLSFIYISTSQSPNFLLLFLFSLSPSFPSPSALHQPQSLLRLSSKPRLASVSRCPTPSPSSSSSSSNHHHHHRTDDTYTLSPSRCGPWL